MATKGDFDEAFVAKVIKEISDQPEHFAWVPNIPYNKTQLIQEIENRTRVGVRFLEMIKEGEELGKKER